MTTWKATMQLLASLHSYLSVWWSFTLNKGRCVIRRKRDVLEKKKQLWLDAGCGDNKQPGYVGMDKRKLDGVDVVHDIEDLPWPFEPNTFDRIVMSHVMEHLKPWLVVDIMNEMWRVMKPGGVLMLAMPYAGSFGHWQDPTHTRPWNEATCHYFDPDMALYQIYKPKPWKIEGNVWRNDGNIEIALRKRGDA